jgi:putative spermidine/putrescine transport system substrate-binding protein
MTSIHLRRSLASNRRTGAVAALAALALLAAGCGTSSDDESSKQQPGGSGFQAPDIAMKTDAVGEGEGELNVLAWPGYAESGKNDPDYDWVTPFEKQTGCHVNVKEFGTSDDAVSLMHAGGYDVVSASGDATLRLIAAGDVQPINVDLIPNYQDVSPFLKETDYNSVDGQMWGVPHGWGANLLMYNKDVVKPAPTDWSAVFDGSSKYAGKVTAYDNPIYIADAALYLMNTQPDLGIKNPYSLDQDQLDAAVEVLKNQNQNIGEYWTDYAKESQAFKTGSLVIGTTWEYTASISGGKVATVFPDSGSTGWSDTWMISSHTDHVNCAYKWLDWMETPKVQALVGEWFGEAPANPKACDLTSKGFCEQYHVSDAAYADKIWYWTTPIKQCLDGRKDATCTDYGQWTQAWTAIKG